MSDDSFIREVDEELRHDRLKSIWNRFGNWLIGAAVLVVAATGAWRGWQYWSDGRAARGGDAFLSAVELSAKGSQDAAALALEELAKSGPGGYRTLARLRLAGEIAAKGDAAAALKVFDEIAADTSVDTSFRSVAALRAGMIAVDSEPYESVKARLEKLAAPGGYYRHLAREALGTAALKTGANEEALKWFQSVSDDAGASGAVRSRVRVMLDLLAGKGVKSAG